MILSTSHPARYLYGCRYITSHCLRQSLVLSPLEGLWGTLLWSENFTALGDRGLHGLEPWIVSGLIVSDSFPKTMRSLSHSLGGKPPRKSWYDSVSSGPLGPWELHLVAPLSGLTTPVWVRAFRKLLPVAFPKIPVAHMQTSALKP